MERSSDVELLMVGYELLRGDRNDSHLEYLGRRLLEIGVRIDRVHVVGDDVKAISELVRERHQIAAVLVVTGGLGPTHDDITRDGVAEGLGLPLVFDPSQWMRIKGYFERVGREASESNRRQAMFPRGSTPMDNPRGTAPGFLVEAGGCLVTALPGPPREFRTMVDASLIPAVARRLPRLPVFSRTYRTMGVGESQIAALLESLTREYDEFSLASLPHVAGVDLILRAKPGTIPPDSLARRADAFEIELDRELGHKIYAKGDRTLEETVGRMLAERHATVAVAESLTGGLLGTRLTDVPGSSAYMLADVVAYSNEAKVDFLGVKKESLAAHGAVSEIVCREMAEGIRSRTGATWGIATTGIAGPSGGTAEKPVGLCYYGLTGAEGPDIRRRVFSGARDDVRERVVWASLFLLYERLLGAARP